MTFIKVSIERKFFFLVNILCSFGVTSVGHYKLLYIGLCSSLTSEIMPDIVLRKFRMSESFSHGIILVNFEG